MMKLLKVLDISHFRIALQQETTPKNDGSVVGAERTFLCAIIQGAQSRRSTLNLSLS